MAIQLALNLSLRDDTTFANFYPGDNQALLKILQTQMQNHNERYVYLWGNAGVGRSHLLQACCHAATEKKLSAVYLPLTHFKEFSPDIFTDLENQNLICLDDVDVIVGHKEWEEAIFHFYNRAVEMGAYLLISANVAPAHLAITLADLKSRLTSGVIFQLKPLSDEQKVAALQLRAKTRGMVLSEEVGRYLLQHSARDTGFLFSVLDKLDKASLAAQRKLTIPFVKSVL